MNKLLLSFCALLFVSCAVFKGDNNQPKVVILGTIHSGAKKVNSDSIYNVLSGFKPDIILLELESGVFEKENTLKKDFDGRNSNEIQAVLAYQQKYPNVQIKPAELEGRNNYRKNFGIYSEAGFVFKKIDELQTQGKLSKQEHADYSQFDQYWIMTEDIAKQDLKTINSVPSDKIVDSLMFYQYVKTKEIVNNHDEFENYKLLSSRAKADTITFREYYNSWADFEGSFRNEAIAKNVLKCQKENPTKKIILLTGFKHRFFVKKYLAKQGLNTAEYYK
ncbi:hypothetical protein [Pedobacter ureilyticus]|uniref:TraB/GumN family protein n=1 Tax=Pedobacter ureilyticus TaxID=1393051 RepID=A0ABW9J501_9SPHI|nr:hypothetical protein [Pedobacter helvus]